MAFSDARNERDRAAGDTSGKSSGGGGDKARQAEARNREAMAKSKGGQTGGGVRATPLDTKTLSPQTPGWGALGPRGPMAGWGTRPEFERAMTEFNDRSMWEKALDLLGGSWFDSVKPEPLSPETYAGGTYHTGTHVPGAVGGVVGGLLAGPLGGQILGGLAGQIPGGTVLHGGDPALAGYNTGTGVPSAGPPPGGGTGNGGGQWAGLPAGPMAPQPGAVTPATPAGPMALSPMSSMPNAWLGVPGPSQYGLMAPGYQWRG